MSKKYLGFALGTVLFVTLVLSVGSQAAEDSKIDPKATSILKEMSEYLGDADEFTFKGAARFEYLLNTGQKIEYGENISVAVKRPKGIRTVVDGDVAARVFSFDGKTAALYDPDTVRYATTAISGDIDKAVRTLIEDYGLTAPLADFILDDSYKAMTEGLDAATYVGIGEIDGTLCHHLAFRHDDQVDWQVWVDAGNTRVPRRIVLVYTAADGKPEYRANLSDWSFSEHFPDGLFSFDPPEGAVKVEFNDAVLRRSAR